MLATVTAFSMFLFGASVVGLNPDGDGIFKRLFKRSRISTHIEIIIISETFSVNVQILVGWVIYTWH